MPKMIVSCVLLSLTLISVASAKLNISTASGKLFGTEKNEAECFLGVPYAKPPVGPLRFARPEKLSPESVNTHRDATKFAPACVQFKHKEGTFNPLVSSSSRQNQKMSEDCLYLNIYRPKGAENEAIIAFLPGEGFDFADASEFDGSYFASSQNIIVITIQYRVGVFGFLSIKGVGPGNMGLWDQAAALEWIKENAKSFGGDASRITLFGQFTGSMSASLLMTSPALASKSLFLRVILSSGVATSDWSISNITVNLAANLLSKMDCKRSSCLISADAGKILNASSYGWRPTIDGDIVSEDPITAVTKGHMSKGVGQVMIGSNEMDGTICLLTHFAMQSQFYPKLMADNITREDLPGLLKIDSVIYSNNKTNVQKSIARVTLRKGVSLRRGYLDYCSRALIHDPSEALASALNATGNVKVYQYRFSQRAPKSLNPPFIDTAGNGDDLIFAFGQVDRQRPEASLAKSFMSYLAAFAKTGSPGDSWPTDSIRYIDMKNK